MTEKKSATRVLDPITAKIEDWVKTMLIQWFVKDGDWICEVFPGVGADFGKWQRANIGQYTVIESNKKNMKQLYHKCMQSKNFHSFPLIIQTKLSEKLLPFDKHPSYLPLITTFHSTKEEKEQKLNILEEALNEPHCNKYQMVASFQGFEGIFHSEMEIRYFLANVSQLLKVGGYFVGIMTDSSSLFTKAHKKGDTSRIIADKGFELHMPFDSAAESFQELLCPDPFTLIIKEDVEYKSDLYLVHCPTFIKICREVGLDLIEIQNITDFFEENRKVHELALKRALGGLKPSSTHQARLSLFTTFIFQKISDVNFSSTFALPPSLPIAHHIPSANPTEIHSNSIDITENSENINTVVSKEISVSSDILPQFSSDKLSVSLDQSLDSVATQTSNVVDEPMEDDLAEDNKEENADNNQNELNPSNGNEIVAEQKKTEIESEPMKQIDSEQIIEVDNSGEMDMDMED